MGYRGNVQAGEGQCVRVSERARERERERERATRRERGKQKDSETFVLEIQITSNKKLTVLLQ